MAWLSDITVIRTDSGKFYLCVVLDLFARKVVAARLSETEDTSLISHTFQDAYYSRKPPKGLIFHSDQDGQYRSQEFRNLLLGHNPAIFFRTRRTLRQCTHGILLCQLKSGRNLSLPL